MINKNIINWFNNILISILILQYMNWYNFCFHIEYYINKFLYIYFIKFIYIKSDLINILKIKIIKYKFRNKKELKYF